MTKLNIIMIDAFKPEYLRYAPYLSSLTKEYKWGKLEMPSGHGGGMEIFFKGKSNILATFYKKENSSLSWIKYFSWLERFGKAGIFIIDSIINSIRLIQGKELHRTGKIPLKRLAKFEMVDSKDFYKNLKINYEYIPELDRVGHKYGTKSKEIIDAIKKIDKKASQIKFDIILSDHGMADIIKKIEVPLTINCFIDSDMARYWGDKEELERIKKQLPMEDGKILNWNDKKFGDLIFLAKTGVIISPNFWYGKEIPKAMHGYDGKNKEMKAIYIINKKGKKMDLKVEELHQIFKEMLGKIE